MFQVDWLLPWEFSPSVLLICAGALVLFVRGKRAAGHQVGAARQLGFYIG